MATVTVQETALGGTAVTSSAAASTVDFVVPATASAVYVRVTNGSGSSLNVTIDDPNSTGPANSSTFNPDVLVAVANSTTKVIKITDVARFKDKTTGKITLTFSATTSTTVEVTF